jgi:predicted nucleotidyltransferase
MDAGAAYEQLLERARADPRVIGVVVFGSRAQGVVTHASDVDAFVVVEGSPADAEKWQTAHGSPVEAWAMTLEEFRRHATPGDVTEWNRPSLIRARVDLDKTGEIEAIIDRKRRLSPDEARQVASNSLDDAINRIYRALKDFETGHALAGRIDAIEAIGPFLTTAFALEGRVRPWNKWLEMELAAEPLRSPAFEDLLSFVDGFSAEPTTDRLRDAFRRLEDDGRAAGHSAVVDGWEPDVAWLRGDAPYRPESAQD